MSDLLTQLADTRAVIADLLDRGVTIRGVSIGSTGLPPLVHVSARDAARIPAKGNTSDRHGVTFAMYRGVELSWIGRVRQEGRP